MALGRNLVESFFDGFGPGALFTRVRRPGAPTRAFSETASFGDGKTDAAEMVKRTGRAKDSVVGALAHPVLDRATKG